MVRREVDAEWGKKMDAVMGERDLVITENTELRKDVMDWNDALVARGLELVQMTEQFEMVCSQMERAEKREESLLKEKLGWQREK